MNKNNKYSEVAVFRQRVEDRELVVLDCGKNSGTFYDGNDEEECVKITHEVLLEMASNPRYKGYAMVVEDAHFGVPRGPTSLAQPFSAEQLSKFYKECVNNNVIFRLFPQKSTPRAAAYADNIKSDETDPVSIYKMIRDFPKTALRKPPESFEVSPIREEGYKHKSDLNDVLNIARAYEPKGYIDTDDANTKWLQGHIEEIVSHMSPTAKDAFQISYYKKGGINMNETFKAPAQLYSILASLRGKIKEHKEKEKSYISDELNIRESTGELPSWKFAKKHIFNFSPWHQKGGVARSNLMYHGARNYIIRKAKEEGLALKAKFEQPNGEERGKGRGNFTKQEDDSYLSHRKNYADSIKEVFNLFRAMLSKQPA
jgi:hypothetical protein